MHKMLVLYPKGQDEKKFRPYYEREHASLVAKLPGLKASRYSFAGINRCSRHGFIRCYCKRTSIRTSL